MPSKMLESIAAQGILGGGLDEFNARKPPGGEACPVPGAGWPVLGSKMLKAIAVQGISPAGLGAIEDGLEQPNPFGHLGVTGSKMLRSLAVHGISPGGLTR